MKKPPRSGRFYVERVQYIAEVCGVLLCGKLCMQVRNVTSTHATP